MALGTGVMRNQEGSSYSRVVVVFSRPEKDVRWRVWCGSVPLKERREGNNAAGLSGCHAQFFVQPAKSLRVLTPHHRPYTDARRTARRTVPCWMRGPGMRNSPRNQARVTTT